MEKHRISIIIAVYNKEKYLRKCVDSVIQQSYKNLEIILVNDGSTDGSREICEEYEKREGRIKLINSENKGASSARNLGLKHAHGDYISFIDADDYISKEFYTYLSKYIEKYDADIVECNYIKVKEDTKFEEDIFYFPEKEQVIETNNIGALLRLYGADSEACRKTIVVWNKLYKKDVLANVFFEEGRIIDDESFTYKALYNCKKFITLSAGLYGYVFTEGSTMRSKISMRKVNETFLAYREVIDFFESNSLVDLQDYAIRRYISYIIKYKDRIIHSDLPNKEEIFNDFAKRYELAYNDGKKIINEVPVLRDRNKAYEQLEKEYKSL